HRPLCHAAADDGQRGDCRTGPPGIRSARQRADRRPRGIKTRSFADDTHHSRVVRVDNFSRRSEVMTLRRSWLVLLLSLVVAGSAFAQSATTATIRGKITNASGNAVGNAEINAVETSSGFVRTVNSRPDGTYTLAGLKPGLYNIIVAAPGYDPENQDVTVLVGQTLDLTVRM